VNIKENIKLQLAAYVNYGTSQYGDFLVGWITEDRFSVKSVLQRFATIEP
jgi:hypothetical protein